MIDYLLAFADEPTAQADPVAGAYFVPASADAPGAWRGDVCIPGVAASAIATGLPIDAQWRIVIALGARDPQLDAHAALELVADRDSAEAGDLLEQFILWANVPFAQLSAMQLSPVFAGSNYPFGAPA